MLLRWHILGANDLEMWVYEEEGKNLAMTGFAGVSQLEGGNLVLHYVWEAEEATFACKGGAKVLNGGVLVLETVDLLDSSVFILRIGELGAIIDLLAKG